MATMDRFRFGMRDALANGLPLTDALGQGISAAAAADEAGRKRFFKAMRDNAARGFSAKHAIHDALGRTKRSGKLYSDTDPDPVEARSVSPEPERATPSPESSPQMVTPSAVEARPLGSSGSAVTKY